MTHTTKVYDCFSSEGDYYAASCQCGWEAYTTDNQTLALRMAIQHSKTGDMTIGQDWEETL